MAAEASGRRTAILGGALFDGTGAATVKDAAVIVAGDRIVAAGAASAVGAATADETIDLRPCTLLPGLIDAHVHLWGRSPADRMPWATGPIEYRALRTAGEARDLLEAGFTTMRGLGSQTGVSLKKAIDGGILPGPRSRMAGMAVARTRGPWFAVDQAWRWVRPADGIDACIKAAQQSLLEGSTLLKIGASAGHENAWGDVPTYSIEEVQAMTEIAHAWGIRAAVHAMGDEAVRRSVLGGVDTVEHGYGITPETLNLIVERGVFLVPTLRLRHRDETDWGRATFKSQVESLERAYKAGAKIALGTDSTGAEQDSTHGAGNAIEFKLLGDVMEPVDALVAGMQTAAEAMGMEDDIGTLEAGKYADVVAVRDDPLGNLETLQHVEFVMQGGKVIVRP
jgi:imidazolonepropionase-like amidohydrolase